jgi:hypothetical protein
MGMLEATPLLGFSPVAFAADHFNDPRYVLGPIKIGILRRPVPRPPNISDKQCLTTLRIDNLPACCASATNVVTRNDGVDTGKLVSDQGTCSLASFGTSTRFIDLFRPTHSQSPTDFSSIYDFPLNAWVQSNVWLIRGTEAEHKTDKSRGPVIRIVDINWLSVLSAAAVKVEESKILLRNDESSNKTTIGLVNEYLPGPMSWCQRCFEKVNYT